MLDGARQGAGAAGGMHEDGQSSYGAPDGGYGSSGSSSSSGGGYGEPKRAPAKAAGAKSFDKPLDDEIPF